MQTRTIIRDITAADSARIKEIIDLSFPRFYRFFASHSVSNPDEPVLVDEVDNTAGGFAKLIEFTIDKTKCGCILWIAVHPALRRRGVAYSLTNASVECLRLRGATIVFASTQRGNKGALATLVKAGFSRVGFGGLWRVFGWRVFRFFSDIWFAPGEVVLMRFVA